MEMIGRCLRSCWSSTGPMLRSSTTFSSFHWSESLEQLRRRTSAVEIALRIELQSLEVIMMTGACRCKKLDKKQNGNITQVRVSILVVRIRSSRNLLTSTLQRRHSEHRALATSQLKTFQWSSELAWLLGHHQNILHRAYRRWRLNQFRQLFVDGLDENMNAPEISSNR